MVYRRVDGSFYVGDLQPGDREATQEEIDNLNTRSDAEIKKRLLAAAIAKRDTAMFHLFLLYDQAREDDNTAAKNAAKTALTSLRDMFNDPRIVSAIDGAARTAIFVVWREIGNDLEEDHEPTYNAMIALGVL